MKNLLLLLFAIAIVACTSSPEKKAQKAIKEYLFKTLNDIDSYEPVEYGTIDSLYTEYTMDSLYKEAVKMNELALKKCDSLGRVLERRKIYDEFYPDEINDLILAKWFTINTYPQIIDSLKNNYQSYFMGMGMIHSFRAKNVLGGNRLCRWQFVLTSNLNNVLYAIDLNSEKEIKNYSRVANGKEIKEKEKHEKEMKFAKDKSRHDAFFDSISNIKDIVCVNGRTFYEITKVGNGRSYAKKDKIRIKIKEMNDLGDEIKNEENQLRYEQSIFASHSLKQGSVIRRYIPYENNNREDKKPYEIYIIELSLL